MSEAWTPGPRRPRLDGRDVHTWLARLDVDQEHLDYFASLLAAGETARAARFHFARDRDRYISGRGMLRLLLGRYLQVVPEALRFSYSEFGKPCLPNQPLQFNLAHAGGLVLYAFGLRRAVGVDLEAQRDLPDALTISERFFSADERDTLSKLPEDEQLPAFFRCWSRKEAFIKAVGEGLSYPLREFDVSLAPDEPAQLLCIRGSVAEAQTWSLVDLEAPPGFHAALVVSGLVRRVERWQFGPDEVL